MPGNSWLNEIAALPVFPASPYLPYGEYPQGKSRSSEMWDDIGDAHRLSSIKLRYIGQFMRIVAERKGIDWRYVCAPKPCFWPAMEWLADSEDSNGMISTSA
jgi:hypothetical protein